MELLSAHLDNRLSAGDRRKVENLLAHSEEATAELASLRTAVDLVHQASRPQPRRSFALTAEMASKPAPAPGLPRIAVPVATGVAALFLAFSGTAGAVQEEKEKDWKPEMPAEEQEMTPEEAMKLLKEAQTLMGRSAELLQDSSRGKALETDRELLEKIEKLLGEKDDGEKTPTSMQGKVLKLVQKLLSVSLTVQFFKTVPFKQVLGAVDEEREVGCELF